MKSTSDFEFSSNDLVALGQLHQHLANPLISGAHFDFLHGNLLFVPGRFLLGLGNRGGRAWPIRLDHAIT